MKKHILTALVILGLSVSTAASYAVVNKVAVVNVQAIVAKSSQVQALKKEHKQKTEDLQKWVKTAKADVEKQKTQAGKEKLAKKYDADLKKKQADLKKDYTDKLQAIDKDITKTIVDTAKAKGYDLVLTKGVVLMGGDDITAEIQKVVK